MFPGGCFFASVAAELDTRPGPVRDSAIAVVVEWTDLLEAAVRDAQAEGAIDPAEDASSSCSSSTHSCCSRTRST